MFKYFLRILQIKWGKGLYAGIGGTKYNFLVIVKKISALCAYGEYARPPKKFKLSMPLQKILNNIKQNFRFLISFLDSME
jgi:hypothetical protein